MDANYQASDSDSADVVISRNLRRLHHPFIHIAFAALLSITVAWISPDLSNDYILFIIIPAFIAISLARGENLESNLSKPRGIEVN